MCGVKAFPDVDDDKIDTKPPALVTVYYIRLPGVNQSKTCLLLFSPSCHPPSLKAHILLYFHLVWDECDAYHMKQLGK